MYYLQYLAERRQAITVAIEGILQGYFQEDYQERRVLHEEEIAELARYYYYKLIRWTKFLSIKL